MDNLALFFLVGTLILIGVGVYFYLHDRKDTQVKGKGQRGLHN